MAAQIDAQFAFAGVVSNLKFVVFEDADATQNPDRILSFLKEKSTTNYLTVKRKYINKETKMHTIRYILVANSFLPNKDTVEALKRRQIIIQPRPLAIEATREDMLHPLTSDTGATLQSIETTPRLLARVLKYSGGINYMTKNRDTGFNFIPSFLFTYLHDIFITPGKHTPFVRVRSDQMNDGISVPCLYTQYYLDWQAVEFPGPQEKRHLHTQREFTNILSELCRTVLYLRKTPYSKE